MLKTQTRFEKDDEGSNMMPQVGWWKIKGSFSGRRRVRRQRGICGDFVVLMHLPVKSIGGVHRGRVACAYS